MNLNKVFVLGNVTRDPEQKSLPSGQSVASFGLATNRFYTQNGEKKQDTEFHNIVTFGRLAEIASQYLKKGSLVLIEGHLRTRNWQDSSGIKHYRTEITAERMQLGPRAGGFQTSESEVTGEKTKIPEEEIPVIEEESAPKKSPKDNPADNKDGEQINVNEIPF
jgi:single-strand DNA-binding protein